MSSIINGLFAGRSGISSHGTAIAVIGDNIANANTVGFKTGRAEFQDIIAGGQNIGKVVGSGSTTAGISTIFEQGTIELTTRPLDLAIDGNGFFVVAKGSERFYTRAGNFKLNSSGYIVDQDNKSVLGFTTGGTGALEALNVSGVAQSNIKTENVTITGNLDSTATALTNGAADIPTVSAAGTVTSTTTYADLNDVAAFSTVVNVFDSLGTSHTVTFFFYKTDTNEYTAKGYVNSDDVDPSGTATGIPREISSSSFTLAFQSDGTIDTSTSTSELSVAIPWNNGSTQTDSIDFDLSSFTQYAGNSSIQSIIQDGQGVGSIASVNISKNGDVIAQLSNGQTSTIGTIGLVNFSNPEGLSRVGKNDLQTSAVSGEPIVGRPQTGTFGAIQSGAIELSTVDIASEFVKIITLQRGFQANSRIITTINQLLNEIIQLA